jgi:Na+-transporting methylmalonyl-CoA/oxaloacetate decarboxylase gamma subunit
VIFFLHSKYVNLHRSTKELVLNPFFFLHFIISKTCYLLLYIDYLFVFGFLFFLYFIISFFFSSLVLSSKIICRANNLLCDNQKKKETKKKQKQRQAQSYILQRKETINVVTSIRIHKHKNSVRSTRPNEEEKSNEERKKQRQR